MTLTKNKDGLWLIAMMESNPLDNGKLFFLYFYFLIDSKERYNESIENDAFTVI